MTKRAKLIFALAAATAVLALSAATYAWFIALSTTPAGLVTSALVQCLPEKGLRDPDSLLAYGSLISGYSVDPDGNVPLVLPGDKLLSGLRTEAGGASTLRTSIARQFEAGETVNTEIWRETRYAVPLPPITRTQRELMGVVGPIFQWFLGDTLLLEDPHLNPNLYDRQITSASHSTPGADKTVTVELITTTYTQLEDPNVIYREERTTTTTVTHEAASYQGSGGGDLAAEWAARDAVKTLKVTELVLAVPPPGSGTSDPLTRSSLLITDARTSADATQKETSLPLSIGNLSTTPTQIRIGVSVILKPRVGQPEALKMQGIDGAFTLGKGDKENHFIDLITLTTGAGTDSLGGTYQWTQTTGENATSSPWYFWDMNYTADGKTTNTIPSSLPPEQPSPAPSAALPEETPAPSRPPEPVLYTALQTLSVTSRPSTAVDVIHFEEQFNALYCTNTPTIELRVRYFVRQNDYMDWTEFYSEVATMALGG